MTNLCCARTRGGTPGDPADGSQFLVTTCVRTLSTTILPVTSHCLSTRSQMGVNMKTRISRPVGPLTLAVDLMRHTLEGGGYTWTEWAPYSSSWSETHPWRGWPWHNKSERKCSYYPGTWSYWATQLDVILIICNSIKSSKKNSPSLFPWIYI